MKRRKRQKDRNLKDELSRLVGAQYATGDQWQNNSRKNEETESKRKQHPVLGVISDGSKVQFCKEQCCIETWNVRSMNQHKLEVVKQEMAKVNIDILGISELKWTGMGAFNSDDHYLYYFRQESLWRNGVVLIVSKSPNCSTWVQSQKQQTDVCGFHGKPFSITVIQVCAWTRNAEAEVEWFLWRPITPSKTNTKRRFLFIIGDWNAKIERHKIPEVWPWSTKWNRAKAYRILPRECKHLLPTTQEMILHMDITRWSTSKSDWLYSLQPKMEKLYTVSKNKTRSWLWLRSWAPYCKIKLKKVGKTTRPFKYDLNQIFYSYTVEKTNRFKRSDLIEFQKNYWRRFMTLYKRQWSRPSPRERNAKGQKGCLRRSYK